VSREHAKAPYTDGEISCFSPRRCQRRRSVATRPPPSSVVAPGRPWPRRAAGLRGTDVVSRSGGVLVLVVGKGHGPCRCFPLSRAPGPGGGLCGRRLPSRWSEAKRRNVTANLVASLTGGQDLARLELSRLRSSFLSAMAAQIGLRAFMDAAGSAAPAPRRLVANLPSPTEEQALACFAQGVRDDPNSAPRGAPGRPLVKEVVEAIEQRLPWACALAS